MDAVAKRPVTAFLTIAFVVSWALWLPMLVGGPPVLHLLGSLGPAIAALIVVSLTHGRAGMSALVRRSIQFASSPLAWGFAIGAPVLILLGALLAGRLSGEPLPALTSLLRLPEYPWLGPFGILLAELLFYGFGEEIGWRGFLLPRLARRHGILLASSLISIPWAAWHIPLLLQNETYQSMGPLLLVGWYSTILLGSYLTAWLWRAGRKSIPVLAVFHGLLDLAMANPAFGDGALVGASAVVVVLGLASLWTLKRTAPSRRG